MKVQLEVFLSLWVSPFVVLAVEEAVEDVAEGADVVQVVQDDHSGQLRVRVLRVALLGQRGQVLAQVLRDSERQLFIRTHSVWNISPTSGTG